MTEVKASPSGIIIPIISVGAAAAGSGSHSPAFYSPIASGLRSARGAAPPPNIPTTARGLRSNAATPKVAAWDMIRNNAAAATPRMTSARGAAGGQNYSNFADSTNNALLGESSSSSNVILPAAAGSSSLPESDAGQVVPPPPPPPATASSAKPSLERAGSAADVLAHTTGSLHREGSIKLETTMAMSGKLMPRVQASATRADVMLTLQQKLRTEYASLMKPENRGLFCSSEIGEGAPASALAGAGAIGEARAKAMMTGRRAAQLADPTQRATVTIVIEDLNFQLQQQQQPAPPKSDLEHIRGATCISDGLPSRLAGQDGRAPGVVVIQGATGIGRSTIFKQLCAQQRVPEGIVVHVPLIALRSLNNSDNNNNNSGGNNIVKSSDQIVRIEDLIRAVEAPLSASDVAQIVRHRIPIVWCLDGYEAERRHCAGLMKRMVQQRRWRDAAAAASSISPDGSDAGGGATPLEEDSDERKAFWNSYTINGEGDTASTSAAAAVAADSGENPYALLSRKCDTVVVTSSDGSLSEQDGVQTLESLTGGGGPASSTTALSSIILSAATVVRASNVERWIVQRWPQGVTREFCRRYCTSKGKPYSESEKVAAIDAPAAAVAAAPSPNNNNNSPTAKRSHHNMMPAEEVVWRVLSAGSFRTFAGIPLLVQCVCDVFVHKESLLPQLLTSQNPAVTLFDLLMKLQWARQLPRIQALLSSSLTNPNQHQQQQKTTAASNHQNLSAPVANSSFSTSFARIAVNPDEAYKAMVDAAGQYCLDLVSQNSMECDVTISTASPKITMAQAAAAAHGGEPHTPPSQLEAGLAAMNETVATEPLWVKLLLLLGVVRRMKRTKSNTNNNNNNKASASPQQKSSVVIFNNRLLVEYFAASHIARHPETLSRIQFHTRNRFLWMALAFFSAHNSRSLSSMGLVARVKERYAREHPLWLDSLADAVATQFYAKYSSLPEHLRHDKKKMLLLSQYTQCHLLVELSAILGNRSHANSSAENEAEVLMTKVRRKHGFFGLTLAGPSHMAWSFEWCGEYAALATLNWLIDKYGDELTQHSSLLSRTLARALRREQLGGADRAGGVIHRLRQLGATIELFTAVGLGSTTAVAECLEMAGFTLDADSYRQCLILAVENRDSDMAALLLSHARVAEFLDGWVVVAVFILQSRVRFSRLSVQHTAENAQSLDAVMAAASQSADRATSSDAMMSTLEFLEQWTAGCEHSMERPGTLAAVNILMHQILSKQVKMTEVHTAAIHEGGAAATFAAAIASLDSPDPPQAANNNDGSPEMMFVGGAMQRSASPTTMMMPPVASSPSPAATSRRIPNNDDDNDDDLSATVSIAPSSSSHGASASASASAEFGAASPPASARRRRADAAVAAMSFPLPISPSATAGALSSNSPLGGGDSVRSRAASFFQGFSYGTDFVVEVRIDAIFWWACSPSSSLASRPTDEEDSWYAPFYLCPDSVQLQGIMQSLGECESVKHIILRLQECSDLTDATLIQLVHTAGPKLVELGVTWASEITDAAMLSLTRYCRNLASLDVTRCYCLSNHSMIAAASQLHHLRTLCIEFCGLVNDGGVIAICESDPCIENLSLAYCAQITDVALLVVAQRLRSLVSLTISGCELLSDVALVNVSLNCSSSLNTLHFRDLTEVTDAGLIVLAENIKDRLRVVDAAYCWRLTNKALVSLGEHCPNLTHIYLNDVNSIGDKGILALAATSAGMLKVLDISGCFSISADALTALCAKSVATLEQLFVSRCDGVNDVFVTKMTEECPRMATLHCSYCELLTDKALVAVLSAIGGVGSERMKRLKASAAAAAAAAAAPAKKAAAGLRDFQCMPTPLQERNNTFSPYLVNAISEKLEQRRVSAEKNSEENTNR